MQDNRIKTPEQQSNIDTLFIPDQYTGSWLTFEYRGTPFDVPLLWFAAEDEGRTEDPTEYKIRKAREDGKVAKSQELVSSIVLLFAIVTIGMLASDFMDNAVAMLKYFFGNAAVIDITTDRSVTVIFLRYFIKLALPVLVVTCIAAILANLVQVGFFFTTKPITPDFNRIVPNFAKFFQRALLSPEAFFNLAKSIIKILIIGVIAFLNINVELKKIINYVRLPFLTSFGSIASLTFRIIVQASIALLVLSIADFFFQRRQHLESLKMSKQEIKEERRMYEGDPLVKSRLRQRMQELLMRNMLKEVPKADVVITNPTHYAVALQWNRATMVSPIVVAKGVDHMAYKIKDVAQENSVPVVENKPLARALYAEVEIGDAIPEKFYEVIALVLAGVYKLTGKKVEAV